MGVISDKIEDIGFKTSFPKHKTLEQILEDIKVISAFNSLDVETLMKFDDLASKAVSWWINKMVVDKALLDYDDDQRLYSEMQKLYNDETWSYEILEKIEPEVFNRDTASLSIMEFRHLLKNYILRKLYINKGEAIRLTANNIPYKAFEEAFLASKCELDVPYKSQMVIFDSTIVVSEEKGKWIRIYKYNSVDDRTISKYK